MTRTICAAVLLTLLCITAIAHTPLKNSVPKSGSELTDSPDSIVLEFAQPVRLTQLRVELADGTETKRDFSPNGSSDRFTSSAPELATGRNAIQWTALSPDGHVIEGTIIVVIRPGAEQ